MLIDELIKLCRQAQNVGRMEICRDDISSRM